MKTFSIPITSLVLGLVIMVMALWLGASPNIVSAKTAIGGGCFCTGTTSGSCSLECGSWSLTFCVYGGSGPETCYCPIANNQCDDIPGCFYCDAVCGT